MLARPRLRGGLTAKRQTGFEAPCAKPLSQTHASPFCKVCCMLFGLATNTIECFPDTASGSFLAHPADLSQPALSPLVLSQHEKAC